MRPALGLQPVLEPQPELAPQPVPAQLVPAQERLASYPWSSFPEYLKSPQRRVTWLRVDRVLGECGISKDSRAGRREFERVVEARRGPQSEVLFKDIRRGWCLGDEAFRQELLAAAVERVGPSHYGAERQETGLQKAERIVQGEIQRLGWDEDELRARRKGDRAKVMLARRLRQETSMSLKWIAQRLHMGTWTYVSNLLNEPPPTHPAAQEMLLLCQ